MSFASEKFLQSGTYVIINSKHGLSIACHEEDGVGRLASSASNDFEWKIILLGQKKWTIQSASNGFSANIPPDPEEEDEINAKQGHDQPHRWVIKRRQATPDTYIIYSPTETGLFWSLQDSNQGTAPQLIRDSADESSWWKFSRVEEPEKGVETENDPNPLPVTRPMAHPPYIKHKVAITIPPGWYTTISAVSVGKCLNLIRINREVQGILEVQSLISSWESVNQAMVLDGSGANSCAMQAVDEATVVVLEFFHSKNTRRRDPLGLPGKRDISTNLSTSSTSRPSDMRNIPDYETFWIFDEQSQPEPGVSSSESGYNAIVTVHLSIKVTVDLNDPGKPAPGSVKEGYNENLDRPRPGYLDEYLDNYKIIFIIDDSGSMSGGRWKQVRAALAEIGNEAMQYDADGVDICFINSPVHKELVKTQEEIFNVYDQVQPLGFTPTGAKLDTILGPIIEKLDAAVDTPAYGRFKPVDIIVLTDGVPTDDPASALQTAARKLDEGLHHMNAVGIQFVQIGNDEGADQALMALCNGPVRSMVDTVPYVKTLTPDRLKRVLLGGLHPSIRSKI